MKKVNKINKILLATLVVCVSLSSFIGAAHATWFGYHNIRSILVHNSSLEITLEGSSNCNRTFRLSTSADNYDVKASALLSAYFAGHEVSVDYSGDLNSCTTPITRLKVRP